MKLFIYSSNLMRSLKSGEHGKVGRERHERAVEDRHPACLGWQASLPANDQKRDKPEACRPSQARSLTSEAARRICQMAL